MADGQKVPPWKCFLSCDSWAIFEGVSALGPYVTNTCPAINSFLVEVVQCASYFSILYFRLVGSGLSMLELEDS